MRAESKEVSAGGANWREDYSLPSSKSMAQQLNRNSLALEPLQHVGYDYLRVNQRLPLVD